jgi:biopolymer transport protein ExbD
MAQRSPPEVRYRQDIVIISAVVLVVLVFFVIGAYVITRF